MPSPVGAQELNLSQKGLAIKFASHAKMVDCYEQPKLTGQYLVFV